MSHVEQVMKLYECKEKRKCEWGIPAHSRRRKVIKVEPAGKASFVYECM